MQLRDQNWQKHRQDKNVFPKNDYFCVEQFVQGNTPCAFCPPQRSTQANQPWTVSRRACFTVFHRNGCNVRDCRRQWDVWVMKPIRGRIGADLLRAGPHESLWREICEGHIDLRRFEVRLLHRDQPCKTVKQALTPQFMVC